MDVEGDGAANLDISFNLQEYKSPDAHFTFLSHGYEVLGTFYPPKHIEIVTFNRPGFILTPQLAQELFKRLHTIEKENEIIPGIVNIPIQILKNGSVQTDYQNVTISVYTHKTPTPNTKLNLNGGYERFFEGFYTPETAMFYSNFTFTGQNNMLNVIFYNTILHKDITKSFTLEMLANFLSKTFPKKQIRLYQFSCMDGEELDIPMANLHSVMQKAGSRKRKRPS
jgi:hypothetical protein